MPYVKDSHFPVRIFFIILGSLLLVGAFHMQIIVLYDKHEGSLNGILEVTFVILYWILVSLFITEYITVQIKKTYEEPMKRIAEATGKVAKGDFSVYLPPIHSADKMDYLDAVAKAVRRLSNLITNMLKLNKLESQKIKRRRNPMICAGSWGNARFPLNRYGIRKILNLRLISKMKR